MATKVKALRNAVLLLILSCLCSRGPYICKAQTTNTIEAGQVIQYSDKLLVSADGRFQLGFFNLTSDNILKQGYLGLWFTNHSPNDKLWVGNRERPLSGSNANLTLDSNGLLKITTHGDGGDPIELLLNSDQTSAKTSSLTLENSGNLILRELNPDGTVKRVLWESFDNPTNSLLPGMKLGLNRKTGKKWILTSWLSQYVPAPGAFSLEYNETGTDSGEFVMRRRGNVYWKSEISLIQNLLEVTTWHDKNYTFRYVSKEDERYLEYSITDGFDSSLVLREQGGLDEINSNLILVKPNECSEYSTLSGCVQEELPTCRERKETFETRSGSFTVTPSTLNSDWNSSISDCRDRCWKDCSCVGFRVMSNETGCVFSRQGSLFQSQNPPDNSVYLLISTSNDSDNGGTIDTSLSLPNSLLNFI